jgi:prepilin-type N-terminal cleavage/methylation domain-containing protein
MYRDHGFTLIETLVALVVGVALVVTIGVLGGNLIRHRANADSNSAAMSLAQMKLEQLRALDDPAAGTDSETVDENGTPGLGPYQIQWTVTDNVPAIPDTVSKHIKVTVSHDYNRFAAAEIETYYLTQAYQGGGGGGGGTPTPAGTPTVGGSTPTPAPTSTPAPTATP